MLLGGPRLRCVRLLRPIQRGAKRLHVGLPRRQRLFGARRRFGGILPRRAGPAELREPVFAVATRIAQQIAGHIALNALQLGDVAPLHRTDLIDPSRRTVHPAIERHRISWNLA